MKKQIIEALIANGFKQRYNSDDYWEKDGYPIKIYENETLESIFKKLLTAGETLKVWEIKKVMQIVDGIM